MPIELPLGLLFVTGLSGFVLKNKLGFEISRGGLLVPPLAILLGVSAAFLLRDLTEAITFLGAATFQFAAFVFVSRLRQRGSFFWHVIASLASNGGWYLTMHVLKASDAYWPLFALHIVGIIAGRVMGVSWAQYIEQKFELKADATRDKRLEPGQRLNLISKEPTFWVLLVVLVGYVAYGFSAFESVIVRAILIVIGLGILQNFTYALVTRAAQRGNNWYIASTGILSGVTFYISAAYLFSMNMPFALIVPYVLSTTLGSATGAILSMILEWTWGLAPDQHLKKKKEETENLWLARAPYIVIIVLLLGWLYLQEPVFAFFGISMSTLTFPLLFVNTEAMPRAFILLSAAVIFVLDSALHTVTSRAGNRNHTGYHVSVCIPKGLADFSKISYLSMNTHIPDIVPVAVLSSCLGYLFGKDISQIVERFLQSRMDVPTQPQKT